MRSTPCIVPEISHGEKGPSVRSWRVLRLSSLALNRLVTSVGFNQQLDVIRGGDEVMVRDAVADFFPALVLLRGPLGSAFNIDAIQISIFNGNLDGESEILQGRESADDGEFISTGHNPRKVIRNVKFRSIKIRCFAVPAAHAGCT